MIPTKKLEKLSENLPSERRLEKNSSEKREQSPSEQLMREQQDAGD